MCKTVFLLASNLGYPAIQVSDPIDSRQLCLAVSSKTVFKFLLTSNLAYPAIQISDPIDPRRVILAMPGCM